MLDSEAIGQIREFVCDQCDVVKNTVGKLNGDKKFIHRYIHVTIFNIVEHCVNLLDEDAGFQMIQQISESLQQSASSRLSANHQCQSMLDSTSY